MATPIPQNRASFSLEEVVRATSAQTKSTASDVCIGVTTDNRGDVAGKLFVALAGDTFDGHRFVADALARGAWGVVTERDVDGVHSNRVLRVRSSLAALGDMAKTHRARWGGQVVTIGGSAGKTTTRVATAALLEVARPGKIHHTVGNLNNLVGVPMTLLGLEPQHEVAVVEVGTNQLGEVARLAAICRADLAVLTCIGLEHAAGLGDLDGVEAEERQLFGSMSPQARLIGNHDDERVLRLLATHAQGQFLSFGEGSGATHRITERLPLDLGRSELRIQRNWSGSSDQLRVRTRLLGLPGALASTAAIAVADALFESVEAATVDMALDRDLGEAGRLKLVERSDRALIIDDCYNANPISMRSSINVAREVAAARQSRLCLVLGDMLELGDLSSREHAALANELDGAATIVAVGQEVLALVDAAERQGVTVSHFPTSDLAAGHVRAATKAGDVILVKGSRGVRLERVVEAIAGGEGTSS